MRTSAVQASGSTATTVNLMSIARDFNIKFSQVGTLTTGVAVDSFLALFDATTETVWANTSATGTVTSWTINGSLMTLVTSTGTFTLSASLGDSTAIQWVYNSGKANGGETSITVSGNSSLSVDEVYINGTRQFKDQGFSASGLTVTFAGSLKAGDLVVVILGTDDGIDSAYLSILAASTGAGQIGLLQGGTVQEALDFITPEMVGIKSGDSETVNYTLWNTLFSLGYPIHIPVGDYYCNGGEITITDKSFSLIGVATKRSRIIFTTSGNGIHQVVTQLTKVPTFLFRNIDILTTNPATGNGSGFFYDCSQYLATLTVDSTTGYKYISARTIDRGSIEWAQFGGFTPESTNGWLQANEFLGALGVRIENTTYDLPKDYTGDGIWWHGDGMSAGLILKCIYSYFGNRFFRMNDYFEGLYVENCDIINNKYGFYCMPDSSTVVTSYSILNTPVIHNTHIYSYIEAIQINWAVGGRFTDLEIYLQPVSTMSSGVEGINVITADSIIIDNVNISLTAAVVTSANGIEVHTGQNVRISNVSLRSGYSWTYGLLLGSTSTFAGATIKNIIIKNATNGIYFVIANCSSIQCDVPVITGTVNQPIQTSSAVLTAVDFNFKKTIVSGTHVYTSTGTTVTFDVTTANYNGTPIHVNVTQTGSVYGGFSYNYRMDASSKTSVVVQVIYNGDDSYKSDTTSSRTIRCEIIGF